MIYYFITLYVCVPHLYDLSALVGCWSSVSIGRIIYILFNVCPFDYMAVVVIGIDERSVNRFNQTSVAVYTPTDRPKSVRNRCVIEFFGGLFCVVTLLFDFFSVGLGAFVIRLSQIVRFLSVCEYNLLILFHASYASSS